MSTARDRNSSFDLQFIKKQETILAEGVTNRIIGLNALGISTCEQVVRKYKEGFRGVIIGTAIVKHLNESLESLRAYISDIGRAKEEWQE